MELLKRWSPFDGADGLDNDGEESFPVEAQASRELVVCGPKSINRLLGTLKTSTRVHFGTCMAPIPLSFGQFLWPGYERETLRGNIVCVQMP